MAPLTHHPFLERHDKEQANHTGPIVDPAAASTKPTSLVVPVAASTKTPVVPVAASTKNPVVPVAASTKPPVVPVAASTESTPPVDPATASTNTGQAITISLQSSMEEGVLWTNNDVTVF